MSPLATRCSSIVLLLLVVVARARIELLDYDPVADPSAVVQVGAARFTILTPNVIRTEYDPR
jgi:hypothetical protein